VAEAYFAVGERLSVPFLTRAAERLKRGDGWARRAGEAVQADLAAQQADVARRALEVGVDGWVERNRDALVRLDALVAELKAQPRVDLAALTVAAREMRALTME
jgi:glutamate dehydrogenase